MPIVVLIAGLHRGRRNYFRDIVCIGLLRRIDERYIVDEGCIGRTAHEKNAAK
jgi:hypothetical protein